MGRSNGRLHYLMAGRDLHVTRSCGLLNGVLRKIHHANYGLFDSMII